MANKVRTTEMGLEALVALATELLVWVVLGLGVKVALGVSVRGA